MADRLDIVAVGIEDERAVIVGMIVGAHTRGSIVLAAGLQCRLVERIDLRPSFHRKSDV